MMSRGDRLKTGPAASDEPLGPNRSRRMVEDRLEERDSCGRNRVGDIVGWQMQVDDPRDELTELIVWAVGAGRDRGSKPR